MTDFKEMLRPQSEKEYREFCAPLIPNIPKERILGIRLPKLRRLASGLSDSQKEELMSSLPHYYLEEYHLHSFVICKYSDYDKTVFELDRLLPFVDNWSVCDSIRPAVFNKKRERLLSDIDRWLSSKHIYTQRFALEMLMLHYLNEDFSLEILERAAAVKSTDYYLDMMVAWFFATALAKRWEETLPYIEERRLEAWVLEKTISKALESRRVSDDKKNLLRKLKGK